MTDLSDEQRAVVLALADDEHLMGQRHTEWIGVAPFLEEDLAYSSIAQDELGHAAALYELLVGADEVDTIALGRDGHEWRSCALVEQPCTEWSDALVRHWLYDAAEWLRWQQLAGWSHAGVGAVAARALAEERYHLRHADALLDALAGDADATDRLRRSLGWLLPLGVAMFDPPLADLLGPWRAQIDERFGPQHWDQLADVPRDRSVRSEHFDTVYGRMREVVSLDPTARW